MLDEIMEAYPEEEFLKADGLDDAIIGVCANTYRLIYSVSKCIEIFQKKDGMEEYEAIEYFEFNTLRGAEYMGERAPIFMEDCFGV